MRLLTTAIVASLALAWSLPATAQTSQPPNSGGQGGGVLNSIAAIAEDRIITIADVEREIHLLLPRIRAEARNEAEFIQQVGALQNEVVQSLVDRILIVNYFRDQGFSVPQSIIEVEMKAIVRREFDGDRRRFLQYLQGRGSSVREFRDSIEEQLIVQVMRGRMQRSESIVSPARMEEFYAERKHTFFREEAVNLRIIQLTQLTNESEDVLMQTAEKILRDLREGESFADLARRYSQDRRRRDGGGWGWTNTSELREDWRDIVATLAPGDASNPIRVGESIFLLYVEERREAGIQPIHEVRDEIETILVTQMAREAQDRWLERLRRDAYVRFYL